MDLRKSTIHPSVSLKKCDLIFIVNLLIHVFSLLFIIIYLFRTKQIWKSLIQSEIIPE